MPEIDDWEYDEWADAAQRASRYERPSPTPFFKPLSAPSFTFINLDPIELAASRKIAREAWTTYRSDIERQVNDYFSPQPDAEEVEGSARWEKLSAVLILYGVPPQ